MKTVHVNNLFSFRRLKLSHNSKLEVIANDTFMHLPKLEELELNGCGLRELQPNAFKGLLNLRFLHLAHNRQDKHMT